MKEHFEVDIPVGNTDKKNKSFYPVGLIRERSFLKLGTGVKNFWRGAKLFCLV